MGVKTGDNRSFFLEAKAIRGDRLITTDGVRIPLSAVCRCVRGRDLQRWTSAESQWMLWPPRGGWRKPPTWLEKLAEARGLEPDDFRLSFVRPEHVGIKVAWKDLSRGVAAAVLPDVVHVDEQPFPLVPNQTLYAIDAVSLDEAYVDRRDPELDDRRRAARRASPSARRTRTSATSDAPWRRCRGRTRARSGSGWCGSRAARIAARTSMREIDAGRGAAVRRERRTSWPRCATFLERRLGARRASDVTRSRARSSCSRTRGGAVARGRRRPRQVVRRRGSDAPLRRRRS